MHVDVDVELTRNFENAVDLSMRVAGPCKVLRQSWWHPASRRREAVSSVPWVIEQPLLRENANFDIDSPFIIGNELPYAFKAPEFDGGIDLEVRSHMRRGRAGCTASASARPGRKRPPP